MSISRIFVPVDFSPASRAAVEHAVALADQLGASVDVVHVWEPMPIYPEVPASAVSGLERDARLQAERTLASLLDSVRRRTSASITGEIVAGVPRDTILRLARAREADLIVMGTHGRTGLERLLMGSVAEHVVRHARCPVLTVHARQRIRAEMEHAA